MKGSVDRNCHLHTPSHLKISRKNAFFLQKFELYTFLPRLTSQLSATQGVQKMQNVIDFPLAKRSDPTPVDWDRIELLRQQRYPDIPAHAIEIIRYIREVETGTRLNTEWSLELNSEDAFYPPENIESSLIEADIVWILDLLDRFGGELFCGDMFCAVTRDQPKSPAYWITKMDQKSYEGIYANSEFLYEHFMESKKNWRILGKKLPDSSLIMAIVWFLDDDQHYLCMIDEKTFSIFLDRIEGGVPFKKVLMIDKMGR